MIRLELVLAAVIFMLLLGSPAQLHAQDPSADPSPRVDPTTNWWLPAGVAGAFVGGVLGFGVDVMIWSATGDPFDGPTLLVTFFGLGLGGFTAGRMGLQADRELAQGHELAEGWRTGLRIAAFLTGVAAGSVTAITLIKPDEPVVSVKDETVAAVAIGGGALAGLLVQPFLGSALRPRVDVDPSGGGMRLGLEVRP